MADVNDASKAERERDRQVELLEEADIDERDRDAIDRFVRHRTIHGAGTGTYTLHTHRNDLCYLRLSADRGPVPLVDMGLDDANELLETLQQPRDQGGYGITTGIDAYTEKLRPFFRWLDEHDEFGSYGWYEQIRTNTAEYPEPSDRNFPTQEHIDGMIDAARKANNPRNAALVSFLADSATRRTLCAQLRVGDVDLSGDRPTFTPNDDGVAQKDVAVKPYTLYDCVGDLRVWVTTYHPDPENDDAPLWTVENYDPEDPQSCALSVRRIGAVLDDLAERAGVPESVEVTPHAFRHAAVGRWKERGYSLAQVQRRTAWKDSAAADMWAKYGDPNDEAVDAAIDELEGRDPPETDDGETAEPVERYDCGNCGATGWTVDHCGQCGAPVSPSAKAAASEEADRNESVKSDVYDTLAQLDPDEVGDALDALELLTDDDLRTTIRRLSDGHD